MRLQEAQERKYCFALDSSVSLIFEIVESSIYLTFFGSRMDKHSAYFDVETIMFPMSILATQEMRWPFVGIIETQHYRVQGECQRNKRWTPGYQTTSIDVFLQNILEKTLGRFEDEEMLRWLEIDRSDTPLHSSSRSTL